MANLVEGNFLVLISSAILPTIQQIKCIASDTTNLSCSMHIAKKHAIKSQKICLCSRLLDTPRKL